MAVSVAGSATRGINYQNLRTEMKIRDASNIAATGIRGNRFSDLHTDAPLVDKIKAIIPTLEHFKKTTNSAVGELNAMASSLEGVLNLLDETSLDLERVNSLTDNENEAAFKAAARQRLESLKALLNKPSPTEGYLFGGTVGDRPPVGTIPTYADATTPDYSYYGGNNATVDIVTAEDRIVNYTLNAGHPALERAFRTISAVANGDFADAKSLITQTKSDVRQLYTDTNATEGTLRQLAEQSQDQINALHADFSNIVEADIVSATAEVHSLYAHRQAAYMVMAQQQQALKMAMQIFQIG